jgi:hypothetical protein
MNITQSIRTILNISGILKLREFAKKGEKTIRHDWIIFDTVNEAMEFFNDRCADFVGYYA